MFLALLLIYKAGINISLFNSLFFLLLTYKKVYLKEKYLRVLILSLYIYFNKELLFNDSFTYYLNR